MGKIKNDSSTKKNKRGGKPKVRTESRVFEITVYRLPLCFEIEAESEDEALKKVYKENLNVVVDEIKNIRIVEKY